MKDAIFSESIRTAHTRFSRPISTIKVLTVKSEDYQYLRGSKSHSVLLALVKQE